LGEQSMRHRFLPVRALACTLGLALSLTGGIPVGHAQGVPVVGVTHPRMVGMVANPQGSPMAPNVFTLQLGDLSTDVHVVPKTVFVPRSAEAEVEGFVQGDFALVTVKRVRREWVASRIAFDVQPLRPLRVVAGTIERVNPDGTHFSVKLDTGRTVTMRVNRDVRFRLDGHPAENPPPLLAGEVIDAVCLLRNGWIAYDINVKTAQANPSRLR
jgi:hypothetical protein